MLLAMVWFFPDDFEDVPLMEFMYLGFTPGENYRRGFRSFYCVCVTSFQCYFINIICLFPLKKERERMF